MGNPTLFLSNRKGGYLALSRNPITNYQGAYFFLEEEWELYKVIENLYCESGVLTGKFEIGASAIKYTPEKDETLILEVDFRRVHDFDDAGRIYNFFDEEDRFFIEYKKYSGFDLKELRETKCLALRGMSSWKAVNEWVEKNYPYDERRGVKSDFHVLKAAKLNVEKGKSVIFGFGDTKENAKHNCDHPGIRRSRKASSNLECAEQALENLLVDIKGVKGIFAGLPWFYQLWSRDEIISLAGLIKTKKYEDTKTILIRHYNTISESGVLQNRHPPSGLGSADATGWLYKRTNELLKALLKDGKLRLVSKEDFLLIREKAMLTIQGVKKKMREGLVFNDSLETWMDTHEGSYNDTRKGYRVEIQALYLAAYKLLNHANRILNVEDKAMVKEEKDFRDRVRERLFKNKYLHDGLNEDFSLDKTIRPNVFIAYYVYPELLSRNEWKLTFDKTLKECWLSWGGLSSISKNHGLFQARHTGMNNKSYHRGDSWYFVNNIAATCMHRLDKDWYASNIKKIVEASTKEMKNMGFIGQCAELSSAEEQTSEGCLAQAWSAATLIELILQVKE